MYRVIETFTDLQRDRLYQRGELYDASDLSEERMTELLGNNSIGRPVIEIVPAKAEQPSADEEAAKAEQPSKRSRK